MSKNIVAKTWARTAPTGPFSSVSQPAWILAAGHTVASAYPLQIMAPRAGLTTANIYYKQYPNQPFSLPVGAIGGVYPYEYKVTAGPLSVGQHYGDTNYGILTSSGLAAGTYSNTVQVTDQVGTVTSVTWTMTVTTTGFIFIDAVNGNPSTNNGGTGDGTKANPFKTPADFYNGNTVGGGAPARFDTTYQNFFVFYRAGTYDASTCYQDSNHLCEFGSKPTVHIGYPGETAILDCQTGNAGWFMAQSNVAVCNLTLAGAPRTDENNCNQCFRIDSGGTDLLFFANILQTPAGAAVDRGNPAFLMISQNDPAILKYGLVSHNTVQGTNGYDTVLLYDTQLFLFEGNSLSGVSNVAFYSKIGNDSVFVRGNTSGSGNSGRLVQFDGYTPASSNGEVSFNNWQSSGWGVHIGLTPNSQVTPIYLFRNTWRITNHELDIPVGTFSIVNDVTAYTNSAANAHAVVLGINGNGSSGSITTGTYSGEECVALNGTFVDSSGNLTGSARTSYLYTRGHEIG